MTTIDGFPIPAHWHDAHGNHMPPHIPQWRQAADPESPHYNPNHAVTGSEIERDQKQKAQFHAHLEEHRRKGEAARVLEEN